MKIRHFFPTFLFLINSLYISAQPTSEYKLVFSDEFDGTEIDGTAWWQDDCSVFAEGLPCELPAVFLKDNVITEDGKLKIIIKNEEQSCVNTSGAEPKEWTKAFTTGQILSGTVFQYGYFEIKAKIPKGNGFWPAYWFTSFYNRNSYQEIDVFEFCGCDCSEFQAGLIYETDENDIIYDRPKHRDQDIGSGKACDNFNTYGMEWTPKEIKIYFNGELKVTWENENIHDPMNMILGVGVNGCYSCPEGGSCDVTSTTKFPAAMELEYVKIYKKEKEAIYFVGDSEICYLGSTNIKVPHYPGAEYTWSSSSGLEISPNPYLSFDGGIWKEALIKSTLLSTQTLSLTIQFPDGYIETKSIEIIVREAIPSMPNAINIVNEGISCCYGLEISDDVATATYYDWTIEHSNTVLNPDHFKVPSSSLANKKGNICFKDKVMEVNVSAGNACGLSDPLHSIINKPLYSACKNIWVTPNPAYLQTTVFITNEDGSYYSTNNGNLKIFDHFGRKIFEEENVENPFILDLSKFVGGVYMISFIEGKNILSTGFVKLY